MENFYLLIFNFKFSKYVEVQDSKKIAEHVTGFYGVYLDFSHENRGMSTCNRLDLQTIGSQSIMPKNLPDQYLRRISRFSQVLVVRLCKESFVEVPGAKKYFRERVMTPTPTSGSERVNCVHCCPPPAGVGRV